MADSGAWDQGWALGNGAAQHQRERKEMLFDEDRQRKASDLIAARNGILAKLPSLVGPNGEHTPEYNQAYESLTKAQQGLGDLYHPDKAPGAIQKDWHFLLEKMHGIKPEASTAQSSAVTVDAPSSPISTPALPSFQTIDVPGLPSQGGNVIGTEPSVASSTLPGMKDSITLPGATSVSVAKNTWAQGQVQKLKEAASSRAQNQSDLLVAGTGLTPAQRANAENEASLADVKGKISNYKALHPNASDDEIDAFTSSITPGNNKVGKWERVDGMLNGQPYSLSYDKNTGSYKLPDGTMSSSLPENFKPSPKATGIAGEELREYQNDSNPNKGSIVEWKAKKGSKAIAGTIVNTKQYGWIKTWIDPYNPSKILGFQKMTPGRQYTGNTSSSSSTDPFGLTSSSSHSTVPNAGPPIDFNAAGLQELPENFNGETPIGSQASASTSANSPTASPSGSPNKSPAPSSGAPSTVATPPVGNPPRGRYRGGNATPAQLKNQIPAPPQTADGGKGLDASGHIPSDAPYNKLIVGAANDLIDGKDLDKLPIPLKAKEAAESVARQYGWGGQGMFNPQQKMQINLASTFLNESVNNKALSVLDSLTSRKKLIARLENSEGKAGFINKEIAEDFSLNPQEAEFLRMYRQLVGTINGLTQLTRSGKSTEAGIKRLMTELPDPHESTSADDGRKRLKRLLHEIAVAKQKGNMDDVLVNGKFSTDSQSPSVSGKITTDQLMDMWKKSQGSTPQK